MHIFILKKILPTGRNDEVERGAVKKIKISWE
jgi:hypothetical protein